MSYAKLLGLKEDIGDSEVIKRISGKEESVIENTKVKVDTSCKVTGDDDEPFP